MLIITRDFTTKLSLIYKMLIITRYFMKKNLFAVTVSYTHKFDENSRKRNRIIFDRIHQ